MWLRNAPPYVALAIPTGFVLATCYNLEAPGFHGDWQLSANRRYMDSTPAGAQGFPALVRLYNRLAAQSQLCAEAWLPGVSCPPHEPAVDASWWGVAPWARAFCADVVEWLQPDDGWRLHEELEEVFRRPHRELAQWLRPLGAGSAGSRILARYIPMVSGAGPGRLILLHDSAWTLLVIRLTVSWGLTRHLKDLPALWQSLILVRRLGCWPDPVARAYLQSDPVFLEEIFGHFDFSPELRRILDCLLEASRQELSGG